MMLLLWCMGVMAIVARHLVQSRNLSSALSTCNVEKSRRVLNFLSTDFIKRMGLKQLNQLPDSCPWSPTRSIYGDIENHKGEQRPRDWKCGYCQKRFVSEYYLDLHMQRHHTEHFRLHNDAVCLADYCGLVKCDDYPDTMSLHYDETIENVEEDFYEDEDGNFVPVVSHRYGKKQTNTLKDASKAFGKLEKCSERKVQQWKGQCDILVQQCFGEDTRRAKLLQQDLCNYISCQNGRFVTGLRPITAKVSTNNIYNDNDMPLRNEASMWRMVLQTLKYIGVLVVLGMVIAHVMYAEISILSVFSRLFTYSSSTSSSKPFHPPNANKDYLSMFQQKQQSKCNFSQQNYHQRGSENNPSFSIGWFFATIGDAFHRAGRDLKHSIAQKNH